MTLPSYKQLRAEFAGGKSLRQLAVEYDTNHRVITAKMQRGSLRAGDEWPMRAARYGSPEWRRRLVVNRRNTYLKKDYVLPDLVRGELADYLATKPVVNGRVLSQRQFALLSAVPYDAILELLRGERVYLRLAHARKIENTLRRLGWTDLDA